MVGINILICSNASTENVAAVPMHSPANEMANTLGDKCIPLFSAWLKIIGTSTMHSKVQACTKLLAANSLGCAVEASQMQYTLCVNENCRHRHINAHSVLPCCTLMIKRPCMPNSVIISIKKRFVRRRSATPTNVDGRISAMLIKLVSMKMLNIVTYMSIVSCTTFCGVNMCIATSYIRMAPFKNQGMVTSINILATRVNKQIHTVVYYDTVVYSPSVIFLKTLHRRRSRSRCCFAAAQRCLQDNCIANCRRGSTSQQCKLGTTEMRCA